MPLLLEIGFACEQFKCTPGAFGFDDQDPRVMRTIRGMMNIHNAAVSRRDAEKKSDWDRINPQLARLIQWARGGESEVPDPLEVRMEIPERPRK